MAAPKSAKPADVDAYLATHPDNVRAALVKARAALRRALPKAVETIKYGMPAYAVEGHAVASFAGWKNDYAVYIVPTDLFAAIARDLVGREVTKGIIRLELDEPVPEAVVRRLAAWNPGDGAAKKQSTAKTQTAKRQPAKQPVKQTAKTQPAKDPTAKKQPAKDLTAKKQLAKKQLAKKPTAKKQPAMKTSRR